MSAPETSPSPAPAVKRRRWPWVVGAVVLLLVAAVAGVWFWASTPTEPAAFAYTPVDEDVAMQQAAVAYLLSTQGFGESLVEVTPERMHVVYELPPAPEGGAGDAGNDSGNATAAPSWSEQAQWTALGIATAYAAGTEHVVITQAVDGEPVVLWATTVANWKAYVLGEIDYETYEGGILRLDL